MKPYTSVVCITGECSDIQTQIATLIDDGYEILDIHSQFVINEHGYSKAKAIIWLSKKVGVSNG